MKSDFPTATSLFVAVLYCLELASVLSLWTIPFTIMLLTRLTLLARLSVPMEFLDAALALFSLSFGRRVYLHSY
jgi:hypothetical protein